MSDMKDQGPEALVAIDLASDSVRLDGLFRRYRVAIRRLVSRVLVNTDDIDDVVQDVFLGVWRRLRDGAVGQEARAYLFQSALNSARDKNRYRRRSEGRTTPPLAFDLPDPTAASIDDECFWREGLASLEAALEELDPAVRSVFVLYHLEGLSVATIAERIGRSTRTIERHLAMALAHCADRTNDYLRSHDKA